MTCTHEEFEGARRRAEINFDASTFDLANLLPAVERTFSALRSFSSDSLLAASATLSSSMATLKLRQERILERLLSMYPPLIAPFRSTWEMADMELAYIVT